MGINKIRLSHFAVLGAAAIPILSVANEADSLELEEVVVTAQKRVQSLQSVPVSVTAIDSELLKATGDFEFSDFATRIPNLSFGAKGGGDGRSGRNIAVRGISGPGTTAYYIDEIALPETVDLRLLDVSRVEVLRGPQGSLYGASSMGGAVRVITNKPDPSDFTLETMLSTAVVDEGDLDYHAEGIINIPLDGDNAFRAAAFYEFQSGVFDRIVTHIPAPSSTENVDDQKSYGAHLSMLLSPTDSLVITPKIMYQKVESDGFSWADRDPDNFDQVRVSDVDEPYDEELLSASLTFEYSMDWAELVSATSYVNRESTDIEDMSDFVSLPAVFGLTDPLTTTIGSDLYFKKIAQEFRLSSQLDGSLQYTAGVYFAKSDSSSHRMAESPGLEAAVAAAAGVPGVPVFGGTDLIFMADNETEIDEQAIFGEVSYDINDQLTATLGLRWYKSDFKEKLAADGIVNGGPTQRSGDVSESGVNPKANITYQYNDDVMLYGNAAKGFRLGGTNHSGITSFCADDLAALGLNSAPENYDGDNLWSYEVGSKTTLADGRIRLNGAFFYTKWDELQQSIRMSCGFGFTENVGEAVSKGFELELESRITEALDMTVGLGYANATITDPGFNPAAQKGNRIQEVPEWTFSSSATYTWGLNNGNDLVLRGDYSGATESFTTFDEDDALRTRDKFNKFDLKLSYVTDKWTTAGFINNVSNEHINFSDGVSAGAEMPGRPRIARNRPRTIGITVRRNIF